MPDEPTVDDVCRLATFPVLSPSASAELRSYSHMVGRLTGVSLTYGGVEVVTELRPRVQHSLPVHAEPPPERRARDQLASMFVTNLRAALREPPSEPARALHGAAAWRQAEANAAAAGAREAMIAVDGASVLFTLVEHEGCWAAVADVGDTRVTVAAQDVPGGEVALETVWSDRAG